MSTTPKHYVIFVVLCIFISVFISMLLICINYNKVTDFIDNTVEIKEEHNTTINTIGVCFYKDNVINESNIVKMSNSSSSTNLLNCYKSDDEGWVILTLDSGSYYYIENESNNSDNVYIEIDGSIFMLNTQVHEYVVLIN